MVENGRPVSLSILPLSSAQCEAAGALSFALRQAGLLVEVLSPNDTPSPGYTLVLGDEDCHLRSGNSIVRVDFVEGAASYRRLHGGGRSQPVAKAMGLKAGNIIPSVLDCTAGLARDAFVLASLGCRVQMCERSPLVRVLLQDGLRRAAQCEDPVVREIVARMHLHAGDALDVLSSQVGDELPDVIYLDPMFPERRKKNAAVKKDMAAFHELVGADVDADTLLPLALSHARCRVVVKRPRHAPPLADQKPSLALEGESTRFDIYALKSMAAGSDAQ